MLHGSRQVAEPYIDELDLLVPDEPQDLLAAGEHPAPPLTLRCLADAASRRPSEVSGRRFPTRVPNVSPVLSRAEGPGCSRLPDCGGASAGARIPLVRG